MKKISKILVAIMASLVFVLSPLFLIGCKAKTLGMAEVSDLIANSATNFYANHTAESENFNDITYHWVQTTNSKWKDVVSYKQNVDAEELVEGTFDFSTTAVKDYKVAIKKVGDNLVCQFTITENQTTYGYDTNTDDTLKTTTGTHSEVETFRLVSYLDGETTKYVLIREVTSQDDNEDAVVSKEYQELTSSTLPTYVEKALEYANNAVASEFFNFAEAMMYYSSIISAEKKGNETHIYMGMENIAYIDDDYSVVRYTTKANVYFNGNNISRAEAFSATKKVDTQYEITTTFDYSNSADVNVAVDLTGYTSSSTITSTFSDTIEVLESISELYF